MLDDLQHIAGWPRCSPCQPEARCLQQSMPLRQSALHAIQTDHHVKIQQGPLKEPVLCRTDLRVLHAPHIRELVPATEGHCLHAVDRI